MFDGFYESLINQLSLLRITDFIDIFIVTFIIYKVLKFIRDTRTVQLLKGQPVCKITYGSLSIE